MIIYITGASGSGKTTLLKKLPIAGYDLDDIYEANWERHRKIETVQRGVKKDVDALVARHENIAFVGLQGKDQLPFEPDRVFVLVRKDYEAYYRDKLVRDLNLLCTHKSDFEDVLRNKPFDEFRDHFWSNDIVNMKTFDEFKKHVDRVNQKIQSDFPDSDMLTATAILTVIKRLI